MGQNSIGVDIDISAFHAYDPGRARRIAEALIAAVQSAKPRSLEETCYEIGTRHQVSANDVFTIAKHLLARGVLACNLSAYADFAEASLSEMRIRPPGV